MKGLIRPKGTSMGMVWKTCLLAEQRIKLGRFLYNRLVVNSAEVLNRPLMQIRFVKTWTLFSLMPMAIVIRIYMFVVAVTNFPIVPAH